ncbi:MAG: hypothetical protein B1H03_01340 [Planctomycetales bacterium 4484_113]|nr:MAG: hypothetical protein B1H03_01340 [Planctomycetales bacterium 4484_113]
MPLRVGVIGAGFMGRHHVRIYREMPEVELVGVADVDESAAEVAAEYHVSFFKDYRKVLELQPELVSIAVPTSLHHEIALAALRNGTHVLVEKPISNRLDHAREIVQAGAESCCKVFVGHVERFNPAIRSLKEVLQKGTLGQVHSIANLRVGRYNKRIFDTGIILDLGTHDIDLISYLFGHRAASVFAVGSLQPGRDYEDHATITLKFDQDQTGYIELSWLSPYKVRKMFVTGTRHFGLVDLIEQSIIVYDGQRWADSGLVSRDEPLKLELASVVEAVQHDLPPSVSGEDSIYTLQVALEAMRSYREGKAFHFPEFAGSSYPIGNK